MRILDRAVYVGPSLYAQFPVIRLELDLGALEEWPTAKLGPAFIDAAARRAARPAGARLLVRRARRLRPAPDGRGGHLARPRARARRDRAAERGRRAGDVRQDARRRRPPATTTSSTSTSRRTWASRPDGSASPCSTRCCRRSSGPRARFPATSTSRPSATSSSASPSAGRSGPSTASLVRAAEERGIPWLRLNEQTLVQLGHGKYQQRIQATVTSRTPHIAVELASDKEETNQILAELGLPVPRQRLVQRAEDAVRGGGAHRLPGGRQAAQRATTAAASRST